MVPRREGVLVALLLGLEAGVPPGWVR
jgi:hypothetical protein